MNGAPSRPPEAQSSLGQHNRRSTSALPQVQGSFPSSVCLPNRLPCTQDAARAGPCRRHTRNARCEMRLVPPCPGPPQALAALPSPSSKTKDVEASTASPADGSSPATPSSPPGPPAPTLSTGGAPPAPKTPGGVDVLHICDVNACQLPRPDFYLPAGSGGSSSGGGGSGRAGSRRSLS